MSIYLSGKLFLKQMFFAAKSFFSSRWSHDYAKAYLLLGAPCLLLSLHSYILSFDPPPESLPTRISGALTMRAPGGRINGVTITITEVSGVSREFRCNRGSRVYCPPPTDAAGQLIASAELAVAQFYTERPDLLFSLKVDGREVFDSLRLAESYRFGGAERDLALIGMLFFALFLFSPYFHRKKQ